MMIKNIYSVLDKKSEVYCAPFLSPNDSTALRDFTYAANDPACDIGRFPKDFALYFIGVFDDSTSQISTEGTRRHLADAIQFVNMES